VPGAVRANPSSIFLPEVFFESSAIFIKRLAMNVRRIIYGGISATPDQQINGNQHADEQDQGGWQGNRQGLSRRVGWYADSLRPEALHKIIADLLLSVALRDEIADLLPPLSARWCFADFERQILTNRTIQPFGNLIDLIIGYLGRRGRLRIGSIDLD
jgi:hypothetical protein